MIGLPLNTFLCAAAIGIAVGTAYTLSPTTVVFLMVVPLLFAWAQRDLGPRERQWALGLLGVALLARLGVLAVFFLTADRFNEPFGLLIGDERHLIQNSFWVLNLALDRTMAPSDYASLFDSYGRSGFITALAYWQLWFGPSPYGAHLINVALWLAGAVALYRTARRSFGAPAALGGFAIVLFLPTFFVWSISALKEPTHFFLTAVTIAATTGVFRGRRLSERIAAAAVVALAIVAIAPLRSIGLFVTVGGLLVAAGGWLITRRAWLCSAAVVLALVGGGWALRQPQIEALLLSKVRYAAVIHIGHVRTVGHSYKLLDQRFYGTKYTEDLTSDMRLAEAARFVGRAVASFFTVPLPWNVASRPALALVPQQVAWYALAALALAGVVAGWRRDAVLTWLLLGLFLVGTAVVALFNGNVGTLVRLRDVVATQVVWLSALGGCVVLEWAVGCFSGRSLYGRSR